MIRVKTLSASTLTTVLLILGGDHLLLIHNHMLRSHLKLSSISTSAVLWSMTKLSQCCSTADQKLCAPCDILPAVECHHPPAFPKYILNDCIRYVSNNQEFPSFDSSRDNYDGHIFGKSIQAGILVNEVNANKLFDALILKNWTIRMITPGAQQFYRAIMDLVKADDHYLPFVVPECQVPQIWICMHHIPIMYHNVNDTCPDFEQNCQRVGHLSSTTGAEHPHSTTEARHLPSTTRASHLPSTTRASHLPSTTRASHLPSTTRASHLPSTTRARHLPSTIGAELLPSTTEARNLPSTSRVRLQLRIHNLPYAT